MFRVLKIPLFGAIIFVQSCNAKAAAGFSSSPVIFTARSNSPSEFAVLGSASSWSDAEHICRQNHAILVKLENNAEDMGYLGNLTKLHNTASRSNRNFFLGLTKELHTREWRWTQDEETLTYWNYEQGKLPAEVSRDERCCSFSTSDGQWYPISCHRKNKSSMLVICQRRKTKFYSCQDYPCDHASTCVNLEAAPGHTMAAAPEAPTGDQSIAVETVRRNVSYSCTCHPGFHGDRCQHEINECHSNPCVHGICFDNINSFSCLCDPGFSGKTCSKNLDDCAENPCMNGAKCLDGINSFTCECGDKLTGRLCENFVDSQGTTVANVDNILKKYPGYYKLPEKQKGDEFQHSHSIRLQLQPVILLINCIVFGLATQFHTFNSGKP